MTRLSRAALAALPSDVTTPRYDLDAVRIGVVHLGIGAFHRAHQAAIFDRMLADGDLRWGVSGVSLRSPAVREQLAPQDGLYTLVVRDGEDERLRVIGAVREVLVAPEDPEAVIARLASPDLHLVTLTITEKGYKLVGGQLNRDDPDVAHDLADPAHPTTAVGFLVAGLARRRAAGLGPVTILSCDNLPHNGVLLGRAAIDFAAATDPALARWIEGEVRFPQSMVDRIVPATTDADIAALAQRLGVEDRAMVKAEPFLQWVIEDRFSGEAPPFARHGVQLTDAIAPWEEAKLRLLNGAHSAIAYLGGLAGIEFVHQVVARVEGRLLVEAIWDESAATLSPPPELDVENYRTALMARFANGALEHRTHQIAMDGSQKLPQRLLAPIAVRLERALPIPMLALAVAAWMRWQSGVDDAGHPFTVDDPLAAQLAAASAGAESTAARVAALSAVEGVVPLALAADPRFRDAVTHALASIEASGAWATLAHMLPGKAHL
ncbi:mannitol dehydrogenase family protein [Sphingomonas nostoxanthinifaciens]|uniref:mannitol dehydrogenase family protein n=1 Tax=Sphingomonas nostoxanthinifaciens TaxID=2872652 RepID=UPI001CC1DF84|nr:mannitol dehydrogenase family protein [Sphingomonas nostoxanthinifaciens]UAK26135.1 mannitol dehydrogenase family protein [Sphingomonas nostoxanthinifaciens]